MHLETNNYKLILLSPYEDELSKAAEENDAVYVGRVTTDGFRDFFFYAARGAIFEPVIASIAATFTGYQFDTGSRPDQEWTVYRNYLYPPDRICQVMNNRGVYDALQKDGDPLTAPREVDHWIYFPTSFARGTFVQNAMKKGFQVRSMLEPDSQSPQFGVTVFRQDIPSPDNLDDVTVMLFDFARAVDGRYDGWETMVLANKAENSDVED